MKGRVDRGKKATFMRGNGERKGGERMRQRGSEGEDLCACVCVFQALGGSGSDSP